MRETTMFDQALSDFVSLFVILDPIGIVPQFLYFTRHESPETRRRLALRCVLIATGILVGFVVLGQVLLDALGIGLPSFSMAGGLVLLIISLRMIFEGVEETAEGDKELAAGSPGDLAVFPLSTPLVAGPGAILVVVLLTDNNRFSVPEQAQTTLVLLVVMALTYAVLRTAGGSSAYWG